jgi:acyl-CoA synthetase (AMP-forming)/AMP-acid ligase II
VLCSPIDFIQKPTLWADMVEKFKPTRTAGPNFAYALLAKRLDSAGRKLVNDTLRVTSIAAEPIAPQTLEKMIAIGFPEDSIVPCYGTLPPHMHLATCQTYSHTWIQFVALSQEWQSRVCT